MFEKIILIEHHICIKVMYLNEYNLLNATHANLLLSVYKPIVILYLLYLYHCELQIDLFIDLVIYFKS